VTAEEPIRVFISYSHRDAHLRTRLETSLAVLIRKGLITIWNDIHIRPGEDFAQAIDTKLEQADIILCLTTQNYLASRYAYEIELTRALSRRSTGETEVIPIILTPSDWKKTPLGQLQALPTRGKPVSQWDNQDQAFQEIADGIRITASHLMVQLQQQRKEDRSGADGHPPKQELGPKFIERNGERYCRDLLDYAGSLIHIESPRGHGKTSLMHRLIDHAEKRGCSTASICLKAIDKDAYQEPSIFKHEFCKAVGNSLGIPPKTQPESTMTTSLFRNTDLTNYFQQHLIRPDQKAFLLAIDNLDKIAVDRRLTDDLCGLLRSWLDDAKRHNSPWKRFRLILSYTRQPKVSNINQSPFNIGHLIRLRELTPAESATLASSYGLNLDGPTLDSLRLLVGGHPALLGKGLLALAHGLDIDQFLTQATSAEGTYREHLRVVSHHLMIPKIGSALEQLARSEGSVAFEQDVLDRLEDLGYVKIEGKHAQLPYLLHRQFILRS